MFFKSLSGFLKRKIVSPFLDLLRQGITPEKMALTLALGTVIGVIPAFGLTTVICTFLGLRLRLNLAVFILISYLVQPLQLVLFIPFIKAGVMLVGFGNFQLSFDQVMGLFKNDWLQALAQLWQASLAGVLAWLLTALPLLGLLYLVFLLLLRRFMPKPVGIPENE